MRETPISLMNIDAEILKKKKNASKQDPTVYEMDHSPGSDEIFITVMQGWLNICKSINVIYHINKLNNKNHMII